MDTLTATVRPPQTKTETSLVITLDTNTCYRESKFPDGHPARACHVGLVELDHLICVHCTWYGNVQKKQVAKLTGGHRVALVEFLKKSRDGGVPGIEAEEKPKGWVARLMARFG